MASEALNTVKAGREALAAQKYFDGVQLVNNTLEAYEKELLAASTEKSVEKLDILRTPEAFLKNMLPQLSGPQKEDLSQLYKVGELNWVTLFNIVRQEGG